MQKTVHEDVAEITTKLKVKFRYTAVAYLNKVYLVSFFGEIDTILELVYFAYTETDPVENERARRNYSQLNLL